MYNTDIKEELVLSGCTIHHFMDIFHRSIEHLMNMGCAYSTIRISTSTKRYDTGIGEMEDSILVIEGYRHPTKEEIIQEQNKAKLL